jgi:acetyltransferase-like isoleucine patch superfamily enzyme
MKSKYYYKYFFGGIGEKSKLIMPMRLKNVANVFIKDDVIINKFAFIITVQVPDAEKPSLVIDSGSIIGHFNHIASANSVYIGKNVLTADKVYISDHNHQYADISKPVMDQGIYSNGIVSIGEGSWIGENVCIVSAKIGKNCVVAANSVVTKDIPDYCVAAGIPARVIKQYDPGTNRWAKPPI